ncbi:GNAT family N-acetyltransferase [Pararhodospirillum photometricum]|nr:N-acetyltransferase [Pararhodospirillum photometricum]
MMTLQVETAADALVIEDLLDRAFGPDRWLKTSYRYRDEIAPLPSLCFTAVEDGRVLGTVRHWPIALAEGAAQGMTAVLLGPIAVEPSLKATGIGGRLMHLAIQEATRQGVDIIVLVGDPVYYQRFGFRLAAEFGITMPNESAPRVQALPLSPRAQALTHGGVVARAFPLAYPVAA